MNIFSLFNSRRKKNAVEEPLKFDELLALAYEYLEEQIAICKSEYQIGKYQSWFYDQLTGKLTFSNDGVVKVIVDYEEVGSVSLKSNTWLWAWANEHLKDKVKSEIIKVREFGERGNFDKLMQPKWDAEEADGWEMTAIAAFVLKAKGVYRVPNKEKTLFSFMIFKEIMWADK